ncbi:MAG: ADP-ribosylglycohydrolase family protein [Bradymonadales bacterium]|nr:ADP-ribosylglycohydrolase family protein [Bradymonadales bacterium]
MEGLNSTSTCLDSKEATQANADLLTLVPQSSASASKRISMNQVDRIKGMLLGGAIGDALGMPVESSDNEKTLTAIRRLGGIRDFLAPQNHVYRSLRRLRPGCWTDDTQLTLAIANSIIRCQGIEYDDIAKAHVNAFENLELRGWGGTVKQSCRRLAQGTSRVLSGKRGSACNGVAVKVSPVASYCYLRGESRETLLNHCKYIGVMTHLDPRPITGAYVIARLIQVALGSPRKWEPGPDLLPLMIEEAEWAESRLTSQKIEGADRVSQNLVALERQLDADVSLIAARCQGAVSYVCYSVPFVVGMLCARPWEFEDGVLAAVNAGGDTDSNGAMVGSVLGAAYGARRLPKRYIEKVEEGEMIREVGEHLARTLLKQAAVAA